MRLGWVLAGMMMVCGAAGAQDAGKPKQPVATLTTGWTYLWADEGNHYRSNLNGWFAKPQVTLGKGYSLFVDFTNYYGTNAKGSLNSHGFTAGVQKTALARPKFKLAVFAEAGDVRASSAGTITNQLAINIGTNFNIPIRSWVALAVTPAEYIFLYPNDDWRNDFNSKAGLTFNFGHR